MRGKPADDDLVIEVWPEHMQTVIVFTHCQPGLVAGLGGVVWQGVSCTEVESACRMLRVSPSAWPTVLDGVQRMAQIVAKHRNEAAAAKSKR